MLEGRVMSFYSDRHGGIRINVLVRTGTVTTSLEHPTKGETQLYRGQKDTFEQLEEIFDNPRVHTGSGYRTRAKLREEEEDGEVSNGYETNINHFHLYDGLDDIETLRIEENDSSKVGEGMINLLSQEMLESGSEFDGELLMEKLLSKWDEEENEYSEETSSSDDHDQLVGSELSSSSEESEEDFNKSCSNSNEEDSSELEDDDSDDANSESEELESESGDESYGETGEDNDEF